MRTSRIASLCLALLVMRCMNQEEPDQVKDLRILAIRTNPPEYLYSFMHFMPVEQRGAMALGPYTMSVDMLVVDPKGRDVDVNVRLCPEDSEDACPGYRIRDDAPADQIRAVVPLVEPVTLSGSPDLQLGGEVALPTVSMSFSDQAMDYMIPHDINGRVSTLGIISPAMPSFVVWARTRNGEQQETAFHRFQLNTDVGGNTLEPMVQRYMDHMLQTSLGMGLCSHEQEMEAQQHDHMIQHGFLGDTWNTDSVQCVRARVANHNPKIARVLYSTSASAKGGGGPGPFRDDDVVGEDGKKPEPTEGGTYRDFGARLELVPGESVRLRALVRFEDRERYQMFAADSVTGEMKATAHFEDMAFSWYTTVGSIRRQTSQRIGTYPDTEYTISQDAPDGPAHVWLIVRDQRGGVDWTRLDFVIKRKQEERRGGLLGDLHFGGGDRGLGR